MCTCADVISHRQVIDLLRYAFWGATATLTILAMSPVLGFYFTGWSIRKEEFTNRFASHQIKVYLERFWGRTLSANNYGNNSALQFDAIYNIIAGRRRYAISSLIFLICTVTAIAIVVQYAAYSAIHAYIDMIAKDNSGAATSVSPGDYDLIFLPLIYFRPSDTAVFAVCGAFISVMQITVYGYKTRTLLSTDLLWASFRLVIAIPLGISVSAFRSDIPVNFVAFGLGAFPLTDIIRMLRRLVAVTLDKAEQSDDCRDDLLKLSGVTPAIAARLVEEGITAPQQLADTDPVSLAIRAGLQFDLVLNLVAQGQVWSFLGVTTAGLAPAGLGDCRAIAKLMKKGEPTSTSVISKVAAMDNVKCDADTLKFIFENITNDPFTTYITGIDYPNGSSKFDGPGRESCRVFWFGEMMNPENSPPPGQANVDSQENVSAAAASTRGDGETLIAFAKRYGV